MDEEQIKMLQELHNKKTEDKFKDPDGNMGNSGTLRERLDSISNSADVNKADEWWKKIQHGNDDPKGPGNLKDDHGDMYDKSKIKTNPALDYLLKNKESVEGVGGWKGKSVPGMIKGRHK
tara:strand:+ start:444 stop:803 length:360 start_codon:yes stop_codon:yes gene_type:complete